MESPHFYAPECFPPFGFIRQFPAGNVTGGWVSCGFNENASKNKIEKRSVLLKVEMMERRTGLINSSFTNVGETQACTTEKLSEKGLSS